MQCSNNLKQIGLSIHNYNDAFKRYPNGTEDRPPANGGTGQAPAELILGVGDAKKIDRLEVRWLAGETSVFEDLDAPSDTPGHLGECSLDCRCPRTFRLSEAVARHHGYGKALDGGPGSTSW